MSKTVLITGADGFLARATAAQTPASWRCLRLLRPGRAADPAAGIHESVDSLVTSAERPDVVLHVAAHIPRDLRAREPGLVASNVLLPAQLLANFPGARHVLASSVSVYGDPVDLPLRADSPTLGNTPYAHSKLAAEHLVRLSERHAVVRFSSIIGPGMRAGSFVPAAVAGARAGRISVYGDGSRRQDYIDVRDAARLLIAAAENEHNFTTLAVSGRSHSNLAVAQMLAQLTGAEIVHTGEDRSPTFEYTLDGAVTLGFCRHELQETLRGMISE